MKMGRLIGLVALVLLAGGLTVQAQGTGPANGIKPFIMPVAGASGPSTWLLGQPYGNTTGAFVSGASNYSAGQYLHFGIDLSMPCGTPVVAVADGIVDSVDNVYRGSAPHNLSLRFPDLNLSVLYGHLLERPVLVEGQQVLQGEVVGLSGDPDGDCDSRPHLHFEVRSINQSVAYNPILYIDAPWHSLVGIDSRLRPVFQRDLTNPRHWMSLEDQPDVTFGGRRLNDYAQTWPAPFLRGLAATTLPDRAYAPVSPAWVLQQISTGGCCGGVWWDPGDSRRMYVIDGGEGQLSSIYEIALDNLQAFALVQTAPPPLTSADGSHEIRYTDGQTVIRRLSDGMEWTLTTPGSSPVLSPDNRRVAWSQGEGEGLREIWVSALDGSAARAVWASQGRGATARWLDSAHLLISEREPIPGRYTTLSVVDVEQATAYLLGMWHSLRNLQIAPGGRRLILFSTFNPDRANDGAFALDIAPGAIPRRLPWFGDYRWRDAESVYYITYDPATDIQQLHAYHVPSAASWALTDPAVMPFTIANGDWAVSPDGQAIAFQEARDDNIWLLHALSPDLAAGDSGTAAGS